MCITYVYIYIYVYMGYSIMALPYPVVVVGNIWAQTVWPMVCQKSVFCWGPLLLGIPRRSLDPLLKTSTLVRHPPGDLVWPHPCLRTTGQKQARLEKSACMSAVENFKSLLGPAHGMYLLVWRQGFKPRSCSKATKSGPKIIGHHTPKYTRTQTAQSYGPLAFQTQPKPDPSPGLLSRRPADGGGAAWGDMRT